MTPSITETAEASPRPSPPSLAGGDGERRRRRKWLRFSLRTLVLLVLLIGSGATLWWNWAPWAVAFTVEEPGAIRQVWFSDDDAYVMFNYSEPKEGSPKAEVECLDIRRTDSGKRHALLKSRTATDEVAVHGSYALFMTDRRESPPVSPPFTLFNWVEARELPEPEAVRTNGQRMRANNLDWGREHLLVFYETATILYRLPSLEVEQEWNVFFGGFLSDGRLASFGNVFEVRDLKTGGSVKSPPFDPPITGWAPTHSNRYLYLCFGPQSVVVNGVEVGDPKFALFDTLTGKTGPKERWHLFEFSPDGRRALSRRAKGEPVELIDMADGKTLARFDRSEHMAFNSDGSLILSKVQNTCRVNDANNFRLLWSADAGGVLFSNNGKFVIACSEPLERESVESTIQVSPTTTHTPAMVIRDARSGRVLLDFASLRHRGTFRFASPGILFAHTTSDFITHESLDYGDLPARARASVWRLRRPAEWYGRAWMPEFWLTGVLGVGLVWSFWRGRARGKRV